MNKYELPYIPQRRTVELVKDAILSLTNYDDVEKWRTIIPHSNKFTQKEIAFLLKVCDVADAQILFDNYVPSPKTPSWDELHPRVKPARRSTRARKKYKK